MTRDFSFGGVLVNLKFIPNIALSVGLLVASATELALACSCLPPAPPLTALKEATAVFTGKVIQVKSTENLQLQVIFLVENVWKGTPRQRIAITTANNSAACGFAFSEGEKYLVYAYQNTNRLTTNLCSRTKLFSNAGEDLEALGQPLARGFQKKISDRPCD
jgi:hypothetical protein